MTWICKECAEKHGGKMPDDYLATFHRDICDVCGEDESLTDMRNYGLSSTAQGSIYRNRISFDEFLEHLTGKEEKL